MPATGDGISVSTLSVETSTSGSSIATVSPTFFSHLVTVPSVTDSPRAGSTTDSLMLDISFGIISRRGREVVFRQELSAPHRWLHSWLGGRVPGLPRPRDVLPS